MANTYTTLTSLFTAIADKIRSKTGSTAAIVADNFPDEIDSIVTKKSFSTNVMTTATSSITIPIPDGYDTSSLPNHVIIDNSTNKRLCHFACVNGTMQALISNGTGIIFNGLLTSDIIMEYNGSSLTVGLNSMAFLEMNKNHTVTCVWDTPIV